MRRRSRGGRGRSWSRNGSSREPEDDRRRAPSRGDSRRRDRDFGRRQRSRSRSDVGRYDRRGERSNGGKGAVRRRRRIDGKCEADDGRGGVDGYGVAHQDVRQDSATTAASIPQTAQTSVASQPYGYYDYYGHGQVGYTANSWGDYAQARARDYADERPEAYAAFLNFIRYDPNNGPQVSLSDRMCLDHHAQDLLLALEAWLTREFGLPAVSGQPWRLGGLDLARNSLTDETISYIISWLKQLDIRPRRLALDSNQMGARSMSVLVDYIWNCPEAIGELGLADNRIEVNENDADDPISALLRCLYNHPAYPRKTQAPVAGAVGYVLPLALRLGGNPIADCAKLLGRIQEKAGGRVRVCHSADPYTPATEEFLSIFVEDSARVGVTTGTQKEELANPVAAASEAPTENAGCEAARSRTSGEKEKDGSTSSESDDSAESSSASASSRSKSPEQEIGNTKVGIESPAGQPKLAEQEDGGNDASVEPSPGKESEGRVETSPHSRSPEQEGGEKEVDLETSQPARHLVSPEEESEGKVETPAHSQSPERAGERAEVGMEASPLSTRQLKSPDPANEGNVETSPHSNSLEQDNEARPESPEQVNEGKEIEFGISAQLVQSPEREGERQEDAIGIVPQTRMESKSPNSDHQNEDLQAGIEALPQLTRKSESPEPKKLPMNSHVGLEAMAQPGRKKKKKPKETTDTAGAKVKRNRNRGEAKTKEALAKEGLEATTGDIPFALEATKDSLADSVDTAVAAAPMASSSKPPKKKRAPKNALTSTPIPMADASGEVGVAGGSKALNGGGLAARSAPSSTERLDASSGKDSLRAHPKQKSSRASLAAPAAQPKRMKSKITPAAAAEQVDANSTVDELEVDLERHDTGATVASSADADAERSIISTAKPKSSGKRKPLDVQLTDKEVPLPDAIGDVLALVATLDDEAERRRKRRTMEDGEAAPKTGRRKRRRTEEEIKARAAAAAAAAEAAAAGAAEPEDSSIEVDFGNVIDDTLEENEQKLLQQEIISQLERTPGVPHDTQTKDMLAELTVCMLVAQKKPSEVIEDLNVFLGAHALGFVSWLGTHLKGPWLRGRRARAGATPKARAGAKNALKSTATSN